MIDKNRLAQMLIDATEATLDWREALAGVADALRDEGVGAEPAPDLWLWSDWIDWHGGECPLPPDVMVRPTLRNGNTPEPRPAREWGWDHDNCYYAHQIVSFRYRADEPGGWVRVPEGWAMPRSAAPFAMKGEDGHVANVWFWTYSSKLRLDDDVTHIRLLPREKKAEPLPKGVERDADEPDWFVISLPSMRYEPESLLSPLHRNDIARIAELHRILKARGE